MSADRDPRPPEEEKNGAFLTLPLSPDDPPPGRWLCTLCGAPLPAGGSGCLRCLVDARLEQSAGAAAGQESEPGLPATEIVPAPAPGPGAGQQFGHYEIGAREGGGEWELGRGTMGVTYRAFDTPLRCAVALKIIDARVAAHPDTRARFLREAQAAAQLRHPNVASVFHFEAQPDEECFYAMELVEGETLEARVRRDGPLPAPLALEVAAQVARALVAAEAHGLVHRDLKPSNLMNAVGESGDTDGLVIKVIDFGLAKAVTAAVGEVDLTLGGFVVTPAFASPEQSGVSDTVKNLDTRSDIFSLGVTLWFLLTRKVPFPGRTLAEIHDSQLHRPLPLAQLTHKRVPAPVAALLAAMLAAEPARRPQTAREL